MAKRGTSFRNSGEGYNPRARNNDKSLAAWLPSYTLQVSVILNLFQDLDETLKQVQGDVRRKLVKLCAFTLAEVLITLGVIGVVAAITIPTLIQHHKYSVASARLKKFYSTMSQAVLMSENHNGSGKEWAKASADLKDPETGYLDSDAEHSEEYFNAYLKDYIKYLKTEKDIETKLFKVILNDGSYFFMRNGNCMDFIYDYNGDKKPNEEGKDRYRFLLCPFVFNGDTRTFHPYHLLSNTREARLNDCASNHPAYCSGLLEYDNWEFKDDYPYKL